VPSCATGLHAPPSRVPCPHFFRPEIPYSTAAVLIQHRPAPRPPASLPTPQPTNHAPAGFKTTAAQLQQDMQLLQALMLYHAALLPRALPLEQWQPGLVFATLAPGQGMGVRFPSGRDPNTYMQGAQVLLWGGCQFWCGATVVLGSGQVACRLWAGRLGLIMSSCCAWVQNEKG